MSYTSCIDVNGESLVLDASVIVNLNATNQAEKIILSVPNRFVVTSTVVSELKRGASRGHSDADQLDRLLANRAVEEVTLDDTMLETFYELVSGSSSESLDDGEAATLAYAVAKGASAVIDERKALRISNLRFPRLITVSTIDVLAKALELSAMPRDAMADSLFAALTTARMRVLAEQLGWVVDLIGSDRTKLCPSIRRHIRSNM